MALGGEQRPEMAALALVCTENSEGTGASFPQCEMALLSPSQGHFVISCTFLITPKGLSQRSYLHPPCPSLFLCWACTLAFFPQCLVLLTVPSLLVSTTLVLIFLKFSFLSFLPFIAGSSVAVKCSCPQEEQTDQTRFARSLLCS